MAFNSRKFQRLIEEEKANASEAAGGFEDDFTDDFDEEENITENAAEKPAEEPAEDMTDDFADDFEDDFEDAQEENEPAEEEKVEAKQPKEPEAEPEIIPVLSEEPEEEAPAAEEYDAHKMWQDMATLAIKAKQCITAGAYFRANDIVTAMRSILVEMMCRANGIEENFNENADNLSDECKQDIYTSYVASLNEQTLYDVVTHIMAVTYKYI